MTPIPAEAPKASEAPLFNKEQATLEIEVANADTQIPQISEEQTSPFDVATDKKTDSDRAETSEGFYISRKNMKIGAGVLAALTALGLTIAAISNSNKSNNAIVPNLNNSESTEAALATTDSVAAITETEVTIDTTDATEANQATATTSGTTPETEVDKSYDYSKLPNNVVECYSFESLSSDQQAEIREMETMSVEDFQNLPNEKQLEYAYFILKNDEPRFELTQKLNKLDLQYTENPTTAEEFSENYVYITTFATTLWTLDANGVGSGVGFDSSNAKKVMVLRDTATETHQTGDNSYIDRIKLPMVTIMDMSVEGSKAIENGMIVNMYQKSTDTITVEADAAHGQRTFTNDGGTFKTIDGKTVTLYRCSFAVPKGDVNYITNLN